MEANVISLNNEEGVKQILVNSVRSSRVAVDPPLANAEDIMIPRYVVNADEAIALIRKHQVWLSGREG
jgi:hypothetical protein